MRARVLVALALAACSSTSATAPNVTAFANPARVTINGWSDTAMEPFLSRDGQFLFFNSSNDPSVDTNLFYARRVGDLTFNYADTLGGVNSTSLDGVASEDDAGTFYFITTRSYASDLVTLYRGAWAPAIGTVVGPQPVTGLPASAAGQVIFDAGVSPDGATMAFAEGDYSTGSLTRAALGLATRDSGGDFHRSATSDATLAAVNGAATTQYAPCLSKSLLELYYTRIDGGVPALYVSTRDSTDAPFGAPRKLDAISGFAEAPTLSVDEKALYYHHLDGTTFVIYRVTR